MRQKMLDAHPNPAACSTSSTIAAASSTSSSSCSTWCWAMRTPMPNSPATSATSRCSSLPRGWASSGAHTCRWPTATAHIWYDGKLVPWRNATTHVLTHSLHYGMGVFEGVRAYKTARGTAIFRLREHTDRLFNSAHINGMKMPYDRATLIFEAQRKSCAPTARGLLRPADRVLRLGGMGISAQGLGARRDRGLAVGRLPRRRGAREAASASRPRPTSRHHVNVTMCRAKSVGTYMNSILANQEAAQDGYDEALLLDVDGFVAEGSGENMFIVKDGKLYEPELTSALEGITRDAVITLARDAGISVIAKRITRDEVYMADEAFFTGTAAEVTPIRELDNRTIGEGKRGPITDPAAADVLRLRERQVRQAPRMADASRRVRSNVRPAD
jgi:branched-chain amino acid aminotransferase